MQYIVNNIELIIETQKKREKLNKAIQFSEIYFKRMSFFFLDNNFNADILR